LGSKRSKRKPKTTAPKPKPTVSSRIVYQVELQPSAERDLASLSRPEQRRVAEKIDGLAQNPRPPGAKKLEGSQEIWRVRVGDYRILYQIEGAVLLVLVIRIRHRRDVYRLR
jgi:mRNA interferase RelE/StbE